MIRLLKYMYYTTKMYFLIRKLEKRISQEQKIQQKKQDSFWDAVLDSNQRMYFLDKNNVINLGIGANHE